MTQPAASRRDRFGRRFYPVPHPETHEIHDLPSWTRLKSILHAGGLETWKLKSVAVQIARRADLQMLAADPANTYSAVKQSLDASQTEANVGTAVHKFTEYVDADALDPETVPPAIQPWLDNYIEAKERWGWTMVSTEASVYNLTAGYAGTADRFAYIPGIGVVAFDLKTGENVYAETALQLGAYSHAEGIWVPPGPGDLPEYEKHLAELERDISAGENFKAWAPNSRKWSEAAKKKAYDSLDDLYWEEFSRYAGHRPMPEGLRTDVGYVAHLTASKCELVPLRLEGAYDVVKSLCVIFQWQQRDKDIVGQPETKEDASGDSSNRSEPLRSTDDGEVVASASRGKRASRSSKAGDSDKPRFEEPAPTRELLVGRLLALPDVARSELAQNWPVGVSTFKQSEEHTVEELRQIDAVMSRIEAEHELPFIDRPGGSAVAESPQEQAPSVAGSPMLADQETRDRLLEMATALNEDELRVVTELKNAAGLPNVKSPQLTMAEAIELETLIRQHSHSTPKEAA